MRAVLAWLRLDLRRRWPSLAVLALLVALAAAAVVAPLAGARRGASAAERLGADTLPATSAVLPNTPGFDWAPIRALPEVAALTTFVVDYAFAFDGVGGDAAAFPPADDATMRTIEKPVVYSGRVFDPARDDEVVVTRQFVAQQHKGVGDTVDLLLPTPDELRAQVLGDSAPSYDGPRIPMRIVGVIGSPWFSDTPGGSGAVVMSPGVVAQHRENVIGADADSLAFVNALVRLRGGAADLPRFRSDLERITGRADIDVWDLPAQTREAQRQIAFEARCLLAFALAAFVAALFLVGQAIARYAAAGTAELHSLRALGMTPRQALAAATAGPALAGLAGALLGGALAVGVSRWFPIGTAALLEPTPGLSADWVVLAPGMLGAALLVTGGAALAAWSALGTARRNAVPRRSAVAVSVARAGLPVPVVLGTRFALEPGRGRTAVPVRPALVGAVIGVLGIVAAYTFSSGVSDAADNPERFGQTFQLASFAGINGEDFGDTGALVDALTEHPGVTGVDDARTAVATGPGGDGSVTLYSFDAGPKPLPTVVTEGRMPSRPDEVLLAPRTLAAMHLQVGDRVALSGDSGTATFTVSGAGLVVQGPHNGYADGGWVTGGGYDSIFSGFKYRVVLVSLSEDARGPDAGAALAADISAGTPGLAAFSFEPPDVPVEIAELRQVRVLPIVLGSFLALLAVGAVGHALATAVRRRARDIAVLRALGMTRWQCRSVVGTQATVLAAIGIVFGVPIGLAVGRTVWRAVADYTPLQYVPPLAVLALLLVGPAALLLANLLAAWPGRQAARLRIATVLRAE